MQAIRIHEFGGPDVLKADELPIPEPQGAELLVRIEAASVNPVDYKIREGEARHDKDLPITLGRDLSGVVEVCGPEAKDMKRGDEIFALLDWDRGSYAQYVTVKPGEYVKKPQNLTHVEAAAVPLAALTAWQGLIDQGGLTSGERVLIHGGAGGVGHFAIQIAKARGAWVAATCSREDLNFVHALGADRAIDYRAQKFEDEVVDIDLVLDLVAGETQDRSFAVLKPGGRLISTLKAPDTEKARAKNIRTAHYMAKPDAAELAEIGKLLQERKIRPFIARTFKLADAAQAESLLANSHVQGKIVLTISL